MKYEPKLHMSLLGPMLEALPETAPVFRNMTLLQSRDPALLNKLLGTLIADAALAHTIKPLRVATRALADAHNVRVCPDCGMPTIRDGSEYFGLWPHPDDDTKLRCTYCQWEGGNDTEGDES